MYLRTICQLPVGSSEWEHVIKKYAPRLWIWESLFTEPSVTGQFEVNPVLMDFVIYVKSKFVGSSHSRLPHYNIINCHEMRWFMSLSYPQTASLKIDRRQYRHAIPSKLFVEFIKNESWGTHKFSKGACYSGIFSVQIIRQKISKKKIANPTCPKKIVAPQQFLIIFFSRFWFPNLLKIKILVNKPIFMEQTIQQRS